MSEKIKDLKKEMEELKAAMLRIVEMGYAIVGVGEDEKEV